MEPRCSKGRRGFLAPLPDSRHKRRDPAPFDRDRVSAAYVSRVWKAWSFPGRALILTKKTIRSGVTLRGRLHRFQQLDPTEVGAPQSRLRTWSSHNIIRRQGCHSPGRMSSWKDQQDHRCEQRCRRRQYKCRCCLHRTPHRCCHQTGTKQHQLRP